MKLSEKRLKKLNKLQAAASVKILIIRLKAIGDTVLITPAIRNIKKLFPDAKIEVILYPPAYPILKNNPNVDKLIVIKRKNSSKLLFYFKSLFKRYDIIIDYINNPTSTSIAFLTRANIRIGNRTRRNFFFDHRIVSHERTYSAIRCLNLLKPLGLKNSDDYHPEIYLDNNDIRMADNLLSTFKLKNNIVGLFVSAKYQSRQYPPEHFAELGRLIAEKTAFKVIYLFGKGDNEFISSIQVEG